MHESDDKADQYIRNQIEQNFALLLQFFTRVSCKIKIGSRLERGIIGLPREILGEYEGGEIARCDESILNLTEKMLDTFLRLTYRDIVHKVHDMIETKNVFRSTKEESNAPNGMNIITFATTSQNKNLMVSGTSYSEQNYLPS